MTEWSLPRLLLAVRRGETPVVLATAAGLPQLQGPLERLCRRLAAAGKLRTYGALDPEFKAIETYWPRVMFYDVFGDTEAWQDGYYEVDTKADPMRGDGYAVHHAVCNYAKALHVPMLVVKRLAEMGEAPRVVGAPPDMASGIAAYAGIAPERPGALWPLYYALVNGAQAAAAALYAAGWILTRTRSNPAAPEAVFFAADYNEDPRDERLYDEIADGGEILIVPRTPSFAARARTLLRNGRRLALPGDGVFAPGQALSAIVDVIADTLGHLSRHATAPGQLFGAVARLPFRRAQYRGFFNRSRPRFFWGRDDYNAEHIIRRQELHRVGGTSLGLNHGYSHYANVYPMWRCISFDIFYASGLAQHNRYTKDLWAADMTVRAAGPFGITRQRFAERGARKKKDIAVFCAAFITVPAMAELVRALAEAFPKKTVWLQVKPQFVGTPDGDAFIARCTDGLANVKHTTEDLYDIFAKAAYAFSDPSTVVTEALHFGCCSFMTDVFDGQKRTLFREFEGLCVMSGEDAVKRVRALEKKPATYDRSRYAELVDQSGIVFFDHVRADLGLPVAAATEPAEAG